MTPDELGKPRKATAEDSKGTLHEQLSQAETIASYCVVCGKELHELGCVCDDCPYPTPEPKIIARMESYRVGTMAAKNARIADLERQLEERQAWIHRKNELWADFQGDFYDAQKRIEALESELGEQVIKFRAMHRRAQMWERRARVWSKWRDGVEYWVKKWEYAYSVQSYFFDKYYNERQHGKAMAFVIELLRAELEAKGKQTP